MTHSEIRRTFQDFFVRHDHHQVLSAPLVPAKDPTLLFTNAGMNQFKNVFLKQEQRDYRRAVSIQKCMRVSGKHNDFDEVGRTDFHHTFFEMLGNFSFGDYFKERAIELAWELLTREFKLPEDRLWITVFREDDEAATIWERRIGVPAGRIVRLDEKDNFWQMGDTGPCGPCSEIHYDRGERFGPAEFTPGNRRFMEIWNLVFMQFNRGADGALAALPAPSIDTGMGMERLCSVLQETNGNYDTDLFQPILQATAALAGIDPATEAHRFPLKVVGDHIRALTFLISDGVTPANEGRGYVLRRILRRAARHGRSLGFTAPFLYRLVPEVVAIMGLAYPELSLQQDFISRMVQAEEARFLRTIASGLKLFDEAVERTLLAKAPAISGDELFRLSDTYGFPVDFARDLAAERNLGIDLDGFRLALEGQKERSRASQQSRRPEPGLALPENLPATLFLGYDQLEAPVKVLALYAGGQPVSILPEGSEGIVLFDQTPFYGEGGGQAGDRGQGRGIHEVITVTDTRKTPTGRVLHHVRVDKGSISSGQELRIAVDAERRQRTAVHHSATHLLHAALREVLGPHVKQAGSAVSEEKLRFDFTHFQAMTQAELETVETLVNEKVRANLAIGSTQTSYEEALRSGAMAIFEEKYGDRVRVVEMADFSRELCGGTHLSATGEIGLFKIVAESSISAGMRRIEALGGHPALVWVQGQLQLLRELAARFNQKPEALDKFLDHWETSVRERERELKKKASATTGTTATALASQVRLLRDVQVVVAHVPGIDRKTLGNLAGETRALTRGVVVLFTNEEEKSAMVVATPAELTDRWNSNTIIKGLAPLIEGKGGGKPDFAQSGGNLVRAPEGLIEQIWKELQQFS